MRANITVVTYNRLDLTRRCLESLLAKTRGDFLCNIVDNASSDGTREYLQTIAAAYANVKVHFFERNMGVAVASNYGWADSEADYYIKLDNDIEILDGEWLERLLAFMDNNPEVGVGGYRYANWPHLRDEMRLPSGDPFVSSNCCNGGCPAANVWARYRSIQALCHDSPYHSEIGPKAFR